MKDLLRTLALLVLLLAASGLCHASAQPSDPPDNRIDPTTGRERVVYPPPRHFDHLHMRLEIDIPDMAVPRFRARQTLSVAPIGRPRQTLVLDAAPPPTLRVERVALAGRALAFQQIDQAEAPENLRRIGTLGSLIINLPAPVPPGQRIDVVIDYEAHYPEATGEGLTWSAGDPNGKSLTNRYAQIHSQGQSQHNHTWFPCHDFPNERLTTELIVTVEDPYTVTSNGRLVSSRLAPSPRGTASRTTWHWLQDKPHPNYLVSLVVGRFSIVAIPPKRPAKVPLNMDGRPVPCYLLVPVGAEKTARAAFEQTPAMIAFMAELTGHPYPWDKYSQAFVRHFAWAGMENTSATTLKDEYAYAEPGEEDDLIIHEIAHQWFGNLLTCKSWEHIWLNEGWASYAEALWAEHAAGPDPERRRTAYQASIAEFLSAQRLTNRTYAPLFPPMVTNRYGSPEEVFLSPNDVYAKGAVVLHMLRLKMGDEAFFAGTRLYVRRFAFREVETDDFRRCMEEASGLSLERFFDQWCHRPGLPRLNVAFDWRGATDAEMGDEPESGNLTITIDQVQRIDHDNPAYAFTLPVHVRAGGHTYIRYIEVDSRTTSYSLRLPVPASAVDIDPDMTVAALTRITRRLPTAR